MKFEVDRKLLEAGLSLVTGAIGTKTNMAILSNVLLDFDGTSLCLMATDLEISMKTSVHARGVDKGKTTVPAKKLLDITRSTSSDYLAVELTGNDRIVVKAGKSRFEMPAISADDFPLLELTLGAASVKCEPATIAMALSRIGHCFPKKADGFTVDGTLLHLVDNEPPSAGKQFRFVSSDGHRLAYAGIGEYGLDGLEVGDGIIIPSDAIRQISRLLDKSKDAWAELVKDRLLVMSGETVLSCMLFDKEFPQYAAIIPSDLPFSITIPREELLAALKRLSGFASEPYTHVMLNVSSSEGLGLVSGNESSGMAEDFIACDYDGPDFRMALKLEYLRDVATASAAESLVYSWVDNYHGAIFTEPLNPGVLYLIMPMVV